MEQNSTNNRLHALDGIRGFAIILVILNHVTNTFISPLLPPYFSLLIFGSGTVGVSLLFILSGFLMAYIYPQPRSSMGFLQKRYTRIFPLFLTMCSVMLVYRIWHPAWYIILPFTILLAYLAHTLWVRGVKPKLSIKGKHILFLSFLLLQALVGAFYIFWIMRHAPVVFNQQVPAAFRETMIGLVNGTLTLPFGNYIPMLDGVYWSLAAEVLFYILYPILCVPIVQFLASKKRPWKILFLLSLVPLFVGIDILSHRTLLLSLLQISYCFYFVTGIVLGYLYRQKTTLFQKLHETIPLPFLTCSIVSFLLVLIIKPIPQVHTPNTYHPFINILWAFPITFLIALALDPATSIARIFRSRTFVFLGTISYSLYLSHSLITHEAESLIMPTTFWQNIFFLIVILAGTILISMLLYHLLERPYFLREKKSVEETVRTETRWKTALRNPSFLLTAIGVLYVVAVLMGYQSNFNFLSLQYPYSSKIFIDPQASGATISMDKYPIIRMQIVAKTDNFKAITIHLTRRTKSSGIPTPQKLIFHMKEKGQTSWLVTSSYNVKEIGNSYRHPFGFPTINDSKNHIYIVELSMAIPGDSEYLQVDTSNDATKGVYQVPKSQIFHQPVTLITVLSQRFGNILASMEAKIALLLFLPFGIISLLLHKAR